MATDKQIEANRINAQKSTGPKTEEGKAASAKNAGRYQKLAETVLLQSENPERFHTFARRFFLDLQPKGPTERSLLEMMIVARWRLTRLSTLETAALDQEYELLRNPANAGLSVPARANVAYRNLLEKSRAQDSLSRMESRLQHQFDSAFDRLNRLLAARGENSKPLKLDV